MQEKWQQVKSFFRKLTRDPLWLFRLFALTLALDIVAVFILAKVNPITLLNPFQFLQQEVVDTRKEIKMYFPAAFRFQESEEKMIAVKQKVNWQSANTSEAIVQNANAILTEMALGPVNLTAKKFFTDRTVIKKIWFYQGNLYISVMNQKQVFTDEFRTCIKKTMLENLPVKKVYFSIFSAL
ncbi:MAG: hypothetical protein D6767_07145 [Candidatus Hydrogenedentota bacterium]|nr:MAG: hypothetical protein D6767_07145 [Candidatus Hydrogenedentota bacterium]